MKPRATLAVILLIALSLECGGSNPVEYYVTGPYIPGADRLTQPSWSPDGKSIAYVYMPLYVSAPESTWQVWTMDVLTRKGKFLTLGDYPAWSPDSKSLAFSTGYLHVRDMASGADRQVTNWWCERPTWLPQGEALAFESRYDGYTIPKTEAGIRIVSLSGDQDRLVLPFGNETPSWSSVDSIFAVVTYFEPYASARPQVALCNARTRKLTQLTASDAFNQEPAWSPDGAHIAWASYREGSRSTIWIMNADGSGQRDLGIEGEWPTWSPDASTLAYAAYDKNSKTQALWQVDLASGARTRLQAAPKSTNPFTP